MRLASPARNRGLKGVAARLTFPNVPDPVFVNVFRTVGDNQLSAAMGAFDQCSVALHGQSARYSLFAQKRSITNRRTSKFKMRLRGLLHFKSNERFAAARRGKLPAPRFRRNRFTRRSNPVSIFEQMETETIRYHTVAHGTHLPQRIDFL